MHQTLTYSRFRTLFCRSITLMRRLTVWEHGVVELYQKHTGEMSLQLGHSVSGEPDEVST